MISAPVPKIFMAPTLPKHVMPDLIIWLTTGNWGNARYTTSTNRFPIVWLEILRSTSYFLQVKKRHDNLMQNCQSQNKQREHNRTTAMLIAVVLSFAIAELPQGILVVLSSADRWYFDHVYVNLGDLFDFVVLLNSSVNFIMYAAMSQRFRDTCVDRVLGPASKFVCRPWHKTKHTDENGEAAIPLQRNGKPNEKITCELKFNLIIGSYLIIRLSPLMAFYTKLIRQKMRWPS